MVRKIIFKKGRFLEILQGSDQQGNPWSCHHFPQKDDQKYYVLHEYILFIHFITLSTFDFNWRKTCVYDFH